MADGIVTDYLFISYSLKDSKAAGQICDFLENSGIKCWFASRDFTGEQSGTNLLTAVEGSSGIIILLTGGYERSMHTRKELEFAVARKKPVFLYKLPGVPVPSALSASADITRTVEAPATGEAMDLLLAEITATLIGIGTGRIATPAPETVKTDTGTGKIATPAASAITPEVINRWSGRLAGTEDIEPRATDETANSKPASPAAPVTPAPTATYEKPPAAQPPQERKPPKEAAPATVPAVPAGKAASQPQVKKDKKQAGTGHLPGRLKLPNTKRLPLLVVATVIVIMVIVLAGFCSLTALYLPYMTNSNTDTGTATPTIPPGTAYGSPIIAMETYEPHSLDPLSDDAYDNTAGEIISNVYETLVAYESNDKTTPVGRLAESWSVSDDGRTYTFYLRHGVRFHDGTPFNADAVKYTFDRGVIENGLMFSMYYSRWLDGAGEYGDSRGTQQDKAKYLARDSVHVINDSCVQFRLSQPDNAFLMSLSFYAASIESPTFVENHGGYKPFEQNTLMADAMCGTGPFMLGEWEKDNSIRLVRNDQYWRSPAKAPSVTIRYIADDNTAILAVASGSADLALIGTAKAGEARNMPGIILESDPAYRLSMIGFNQKIAPFDNPAVRQAFIESFDSASYRRDWMNGYTSPMTGPILKDMLYYNPSLMPASYNPGHARSLLQSAGYSSNKKTTITVYYPSSSSNFEHIMEMLKQQIEGYGLGITINLVDTDYGNYLNLLSDKQLPLYYINWEADYPYPDCLVVMLYKSNGIYSPDLGYSNKAVDDLYENAIAERDPYQEQLYWDELVRKVNGDYEFIYVSQNEATVIYNSRLIGYEYNPSKPNVDYYNIQKT